MRGLDWELLTTLCSLFIEEVRKALLSSHCSCPPHLAGWLLGQRDKRDLASSQSCIQLKVCLLKLSPVGQHLYTRDTLKTISESQKPQQKDAEQPLLLTSIATEASPYLRIQYDCNQKLQITWHFSSFSDCFSLGDAFSFEESHHNSNLWEIDRTYALHIKTTAAFTKLLLISTRRLYHCNTTSNSPCFILQPSFSSVCSSADSPAHLELVIPEVTTGDRCSTSWLLHRRLSYWLRLEIFDAIYHLNAERIFELNGGLWNSKESLICAVGDGRVPSSQFSSYWSVERWWATSVTPSLSTHTGAPFKDCKNQKVQRTVRHSEGSEC